MVRYETTIPHTGTPWRDGRACCGCLTILVADVLTANVALIAVCNECGLEIGRGTLVPDSPVANRIESYKDYREATSQAEAEQEE